MRCIYFAIIFAALQAINTPAMAQNEASNADTKLALELAELKQEKLSVESKFKTLEAACYKKFAVSNCLQEVKTEKLLVLGDIKRRELAINDAKRQLKADEINKKSKKLVEKEDMPASVSNASKSAKAAKAVNRSRSENNRAEPVPKDQGKLSEQRTFAAHQRVLESNNKQAASQQKAKLRTKKLSEAEEQAAKFNKKLLEAEVHKNAVEKAKAEKSKPKSAPLPIPSAEQMKP
jgi:colicin import membrane protein